MQYQDYVTNALSCGAKRKQKLQQYPRSQQGPLSEPREWRFPVRVW
jgi:hypothetical protein